MADLIITERQDIVAIANAVRNKTGKTNELTLSGIVSGINGIETGVELPALKHEASSCDLLAGKELIDSEGNVVEGAMTNHGDLGGNITIDAENYYYDIPEGYHNGGASVSVLLEEKTVTPTDTQQIITPSAGCVLSKVTVKAASGGGSSNPSASPKEVNFYDYDGTILYSYTIEEAQALTELPPLPTQQGLICQGWNYDLDTIKSYNRAVNVGATYITDDGKTRLYIRIAAEGRMTVPLYFSQTVDNGVTIDWGDGSATETLSSAGFVNTSHTYSNIGDYVISLEVTNGCILSLASESSYSIMGNDVVETLVYRNMLQRVEIGECITNISNNTFNHCHSLSSIVIPNNVTSIGGLAFVYCYSLTSVTIPDSVTSIGNAAFYGCSSLTSVVIPDGVTLKGYQAFYNCSSLASITIPDGVTSIGNSTFEGCHSLSSIVIPNSVTSIGTSVFWECYGVAMYDFTACTSIPTLSNVNVFDSIPLDCIIKVPALLYAEWILATNWNVYASQIVDEFGNQNSGDSSDSGEIIEFTIKGIGASYSCQATKGMTWMEWCDSEYNIANLYVEGQTITDGMMFLSRGDYEEVLPDETIMADYAYKLEM